MSVYERRCGCIDYDYGPSHRCPDHPGDDDCAHVFIPTETPYPDGTRLTETCTICHHVRGRA